MNKYLLLRDNKQTGPFTAEELAAKGLKAYDLVWQEGRSAAWRYPSEIEELKAFSPVVEEQPYDRFYKKPGEQSQTQQQVIEQQPVTAIQEQVPVAKQVEQATGKHIHVTMPVSKATTTTTPVAKKEEPKPVTQTAGSTNTSQQKKAAASSYIVSQEDDELNSGMLKGYQSRKREDEVINNGYLSDYESRKAAFDAKKSGNVTTTKQAEKIAVDKTVKTTTDKSDKKESYYSTSSSRKKESIDLKALLAGSGRYLQDNKNLTRTLVAAVLILGGVVIGLIINSGHRQPDNTQVLESLVKEIRQQQNEKTAAPEQPASETPRKNSNRHNNEEASNNNANSNTEPTYPSGSRTVNQPEQSALKHAVIRKENNTTTSPNQNKPPLTVPVSNTNTEPVEPTQTVVVESKEKTITQEMLEKARRNIYDQVRVEASAFKVGLLGGISDLDITVLNSSLYPLDQVSVEIKYFGPEKKLVKTQTLIFNNIPAGKRRTLEAPRTNRGISIDYSVTSINSKALGLAQAGY